MFKISKRIKTAQLNACIALGKIALALGVLVFCFTSAKANSNNGTVELGLDFGVSQRVSSGEYDRTATKTEVPIRFRAATFITNAAQIEAHLTFRPSSNTSGRGMSLGYYYHLVSETSRFTPFLGSFGIMNRQDFEGQDLDRFGLGISVGLKNLTEESSPRFEAFILRQFETDNFPATIAIGVRVGFTAFFKSNSAWDK